MRGGILSPGASNSFSRELTVAPEIDRSEDVNQSSDQNVNATIAPKLEIAENTNLEENSPVTRKRSERLPFTKPILRFGNPVTH